MTRFEIPFTVLKSLRALLKNIIKKKIGGGAS